MDKSLVSMRDLINRVNSRGKKLDLSTFSKASKSKNPELFEEILNQGLKKLKNKSGAVITGDYRYLLWREWDSDRQTISFIMLNPSRADAEVNDPTITRCINFAKSWGYGRLEVVNLFAYRTHKPSLLKQVAEPIGRDNDRHILESVERCDRVILAWGNHGTWRKQDLYTFELLKGYDYLYSLGITKKGCPRHPLYLRSTIKPLVYC